MGIERQPPPNLGPDDEYRHPVPKGAEDHLFGDTLWVSVVDPKANIFGINHIHLTNKGFARYEALYLIDGVPQLWANKVPLDPKTEGDKGPWSDGRLTYEVVDPYGQIRITFDGPAYGFDLDFTARFATFDYADSVRGDPLAVAYPFHSGHYEQAMDCRGTFEIRGGPSAGETRTIECWSHRDHTWSDRFYDEQAWEYTEGHVSGHFWPSVQLPDAHLNVFGLQFLNHLPPEERVHGGFVSTAEGNRPIIAATAEVEPDDGPGRRTPTQFRYEFTMPDGDVIHVRSTKVHGQVKLWNRGENDAENRMDCYEPFVDWIVEETGQTGNGVAENSVYPPWPRWPL